MRTSRNDQRHRPCRSNREHQLVHRARGVADAFAAVQAVPQREPLDLLAYAERVAALEDAWHGLLATLAA